MCPRCGDGKPLDGLCPTTHQGGIGDTTSQSSARNCFTPLRRPIGVTLTSAQTQAVAMVIHELATNAAKHGALSGTDGKVLVNWDCTGADRAAILTITWRELGGSPITAPVQFGYGLGLIRDLVPHELGGAVNLTFPPDGACCKIEIPSGKTCGSSAPGQSLGAGSLRLGLARFSRDRARRRPTQSLSGLGDDTPRCAINANIRATLARFRNRTTDRLTGRQTLAASPNPMLRRRATNKTFTGGRSAFAAS